MRILLSALLVFQLSLGLTFASLPLTSSKAAAQIVSHETSNSDDAVDTEITTFENEVNESTSESIPHDVDVQKFTFLGNQSRQHYEEVLVDGQWQDKLVDEIALRGDNVANEGVTDLNPAKDLRVVYDAAKKQVVIERRVFNKKTNRSRLTDAHIINGIELTSNVYTDPNIIVAVGKDGVHMATWINIYESAFKRPVLFDAVAPAPLNGEVITHVASLNPESDRVELKPYRDNGSLPEMIGVGDLQLSSATGKHLLTREELADDYIQHGEFIDMLIDALFHDPARTAMTAQIAAQSRWTWDQIQQAKNSLLDAQPKTYEQNFVLSGLASFAGQTDSKTFQSIILKNKDGRAKLSSVLSDNRTRFSSNPGDDGSWARIGQRIEQARRLYDQYGVPQKSFADVYIESAEHPDPEQYNKVVERIAQLKNRWRARALAHMKNYWPAYTTAASVLFTLHWGIPLALKYGGSASQYTAATILHILDWSTRIPLISSVTTTMKTSVQHMLGDPYVMQRATRGMLLMASFLPISLLATMPWGLKQSRSWTMLQAFYNSGTRVYGKVARPIQEYYWKLLGFGGIYKWQKNLPDEDVIYNTRAWTHGKEKSDQALNTYLGEKRQLNINSAIVTAALLVWQESKDAGEEVDPGSLILWANGKSITSFADDAYSPEDLSQRLEIQSLILKELSKTREKGAQKIDPDSVAYFVSVFEKGRHEFKVKLLSSELAEEKVKSQGWTNEKAIATVEYLKDQGIALQRFLSHNALSFIVLNPSASKLADSLRGVEVSKRSSRVAFSQYSIDYPSSNLAEELSFSTGYDSIGRFAFTESAGAQALGGQLGQPIIYWLQGASDTPGELAAETLTNAFPAKSPEDIQRLWKRNFSLREEWSAVRQGSVDPNAPRYFGNHAKYIRNLFNGFQPRFLADFATRSVGLGLAGKAAGVGGFMFLAKTALLSTLFLTLKTSVAYGATGAAIGYAIIWPYVNAWVNHLVSASDRNTAKTMEADLLLTTGIENNSLEHAQKGVEALQLLYREGRTPIPLGFEKAPSQFSVADAAQFLAVARATPPVPTTKTWYKTDLIANLAGGVMISTALFVTVETMIYHLTGSPVKLIENAAIGTAATYFAVNQLSRLEQSYVEWHSRGNRIKDKFKDCLTALSL